MDTITLTATRKDNIIIIKDRRKHFAKIYEQKDGRFLVSRCGLAWYKATLEDARDMVIELAEMQLSFFNLSNAVRIQGL